MKKIVRLTESDLTRIVKRVIKEQVENEEKELLGVLREFLKDLYSPEQNAEFLTDFFESDGKTIDTIYRFVDSLVEMVIMRYVVESLGDDFTGSAYGDEYALRFNDLAKKYGQTLGEKVLSLEGDYFIMILNRSLGKPNHFRHSDIPKYKFRFKSV